MTICNSPSFRFILVTYLAYLPAISLATPSISNNGYVDLGSRVDSTVHTTKTYRPNSGIPVGSLLADNTGSIGAITASNLTPNYADVVANSILNVNIDLNFINGNAKTNSRRHISLADSNFFNPPEWKTFALLFDAALGEATAIANGWKKEVDGVLTPVAGFSDLWVNVYSTEIRMLVAVGSVAGIENYITSTTQAPAAVWLFGVGLLALFVVVQGSKYKHHL